MKKEKKNPELKEYFHLCSFRKMSRKIQLIIYSLLYSVSVLKLDNPVIILTYSYLDFLYITWKFYFLSKQNHKKIKIAFKIKGIIS